MSLQQHLLRICTILFLGCFCLSTAWAGGGVKSASNYGVTSSQNSQCATASFPDADSGATATCFLGSSESPGGPFLFNFTVDSPTNRVPSFSVLSFDVNLGGGFADFALVDGCSSNTSSGAPVPCDTSTSSTLPFSVSGSLSPGTQTFLFTGFTGNQSGNVTVVFDCGPTTVCSEPLITDIETGATPTPEPRFYAFLALAVLSGAGLTRRRVWSAKTS